MPVLGITGGIATGKSTFTRLLLEELPAERFDADAEARALLNGDVGVSVAVREAFGPGILGPEGGVDRARLRESVFRDPAQLRKLEAILHPSILARLNDSAARARREDRWLLADVPLLFEVGLETVFDAVVVVACREQTQRARIETERGLSAEMATRIMTAQQSLASKVVLGGHLAWSDCPLATLQRQAQLLASYLQKRYG